MDSSKQIKEPLQIAVVGHTNTGKTSLLRTLTRDPTFGEVNDAPGTTRQVQSVGVWLEEKEVLRWYDTPGLEDSVRLRDWIDGLSAPGQRLDGTDRIERFLSDAQASKQFEQERRVLNQITHSDAALYVVDARDPVLAKHRDELYLLQACAKPVLPVMNFTADPDADTSPWLTTFARHGMHIHLSFDTVSPPVNGEQMMYETLGQLLGEHRVLFDRIAQQVRSERRKRMKAAVEMLATLCLEVAGNPSLVSNQPQAIESGIQAYEANVRKLEKDFVDRLLSLYRFGQLGYLPNSLGLSSGQWTQDLFSGQALADLGIDVGKAAAVGAAAGVAVDLLSAGLSLGTGTLIGAVAGSAWQGIERWGKDLSARFRGQRPLIATDSVLLVLAIRNLRLIAALEQRGHAAQSPIAVSSKINAEVLDQRAFLRVVNKTRQQALRWHLSGALVAGYQQSSANRKLQEIFLESEAFKLLREDGLH